MSSIDSQVSDIDTPCRHRATPVHTTCTIVLERRRVPPRYYYLFLNVMFARSFVLIAMVLACMGFQSIFRLDTEQQTHAPSPHASDDWFARAQQTPPIMSSVAMVESEEGEEGEEEVDVADVAGWSTRAVLRKRLASRIWAINGSVSRWQRTLHRNYSRLALRRQQLGPLGWRRNRKKITELTEITSIKQEEPVVASMDANPAAEDATSVQAAPSSVAWLRRQWGGPQQPAAAKAPAVGGQATPKRSARRKRKRWRGKNIFSVCLELQARHGVRPGSSWGSLPVEQQRGWQDLGCDGKLGTDHGGDGAVGRTGDGRTQTDDRTAGGTQAALICRSWYATYNVAVGRSWGTLPPDLRERWTALGCDRDVELQQLLPPSQQPDLQLMLQPLIEPDRGGGGGLAISTTQSAAAAAALCLEMQIKHSVVIRVDWGTLPVARQRQWGALQCDRHLAGLRAPR